MIGGGRRVLAWGGIEDIFFGRGGRGGGRGGGGVFFVMGQP